MSRPDAGWMEDAACVQPEYSGLPWLGEPYRVRAVHLARMGSVCSTCPVVAACAGHADRLDVTAGFWAGAFRTVREPGQLVLDLGQLGGSA